MTTLEKSLRIAVGSALCVLAIAALSRWLFPLVNNVLWTLSFGVPTWLIGIFWLIPFLLAYGIPMALLAWWIVGVWSPRNKPPSGRV